jgi:hypothetical protein
VSARPSAKRKGTGQYWQSGERRASFFRSRHIHSLGLAVFPEMSRQQYSGQSLFTGIEELVNQIRVLSDVSFPVKHF